MANEYGPQISFNVYELTKVATVRDFDEAFGLVFIRSFDDRDEADIWIADEGKRQSNYTILEIKRNK